MTIQMTETVGIVRYAGVIALLIDHAWLEKRSQPRLAEAALKHARRKVSNAHPWAKGIRIRKADRAELVRTLVETSPERVIESQRALYRSLPDDDLIRAATICLHSANRRAKHLAGGYWDIGGTRVETERDKIYKAKNAFLRAAVEAGCYDRVETFATERAVGYHCNLCDRAWGGYSDTCYECGGSGDETAVTETWYIVDLGDGYRFHQPRPFVNDVFAPIATQVEAHNPTQPARAIPPTEWLEQLHLEIIETATQRLIANKVLANVS